MYFAPGHWVVHARRTVENAVWPMILIQPWRLTLLFVVSGYASRSLYARRASAAGFFRSRSMRLLVPLLFGIAVIVPPQAWVEMVAQQGYSRSVLHFWLVDWFSFSAVNGEWLPHTSHLWFLLYLWVYTMLLAAALAWLPGQTKAWTAERFAQFGISLRLLLIPLACLFIGRFGLLFTVPEGSGILNDWAGHAVYFPAFLFGFGLAGTPGLWPAIERLQRPALAVALISFVALYYVEIAFPEGSPRSHEMQATDRLAAVSVAWSMILLLLGFAQRRLNFDSPLRATLSEAAFPFYIIHQPVIVLVGWWLLGSSLPLLAQFLILVSATVSGCIAFYLGGRRVSWLRPLIGLQPNANRTRRESSPLPA